MIRCLWLLLVLGSPAAAAEGPIDDHSRIELAVERMMSGDLAGATLLLDAIRPDGAEMQDEIAYFRAQVLRLQGDQDAARSSLLELAEQRPPRHRTFDAAFLLADLEAQGGRPEAALTWLNRVREETALRGADLEKWRLTHATFSADLEEVGPAERVLLRALSRVKHDVSWYEARAWSRLATVRLERAKRVDISHIRKGPARRALRDRQGWILNAELAINNAIRLKEPEWVLEGILRLADGYEVYGDALRSAPVPPHLTEEQRTLYRDGIHEEVERAWLRALRYLDQAQDMVARLEWAGRRAEAVKQQRQRLERRIALNEARPPEGDGLPAEP